MRAFRGAFVFLCLTASLTAQAEPARQEYCARTAEDFLRLAHHTPQMLPFANDGGMLGKGVCWWHSRFQRAVTYLAVFDHKAPRPTRDEAKHIIHAFRKRREVVIIPGYSRFAEFASDHQDLIQNELERWQLFDGTIGFSWTRGIVGQTSLSSRRLKTRMDEIFEEFSEKKRVLFLKFQYAGPLSHGLLLLDMQPTPRGGYQLQLIDSNFAQTVREVEYLDGQTAITNDELRGIPYISYSLDLRRIDRAFERFCGHPIARAAD